MEWLTLLKMLQEAENAETVAELQQQVNQMQEILTLIGDQMHSSSTIAFLIRIGLLLVIGGLVWAILKLDKQLKQLSARVEALTAAGISGSNGTIQES